MTSPLTVRATLAVVLTLVGAAQSHVHSTAAPAPIIRPAAPVAAPAPPPPLELLSATRKGARLSELAFRTPYLEGTTRVRVLTPAGYDRDPRRRWPVLWLLHGTSEAPPGTEPTGYTSWTDKGNAEAITRPARFIVVMPEARAGLYTDHYGVAGEGGPAWETYHIRQLLPWVDRHYRTLPTRAARAVAGLSMGGGGAMSYAARHPDLFSLAESYSGAVDPTDAGQELGGVPVRATDINQALLPTDGRPPESAFGPWATEEVRTRTHAAADMVGNLRHTLLTLRTGDGTNEQGLITDPLEFGVHGQGVNLHRALDRAGISHTWDDYGAGGHTWDRFSRGLALLVRPLNAHFASGVGRTPSSFSFTTAEERADVHGYHALSDRGFMEFATYDVSPGRVAVSGSGVFTLTTVGRYPPGSRYALTAVRNGTTQVLVLRADRLGRLSFAVDTGVRSGGQQYRRTSGTTRVNQVQVSIRPL